MSSRKVFDYRDAGGLEVEPIISSLKVY